VFQQLKGLILGELAMATNLRNTLGSKVKNISIDHLLGKEKGNFIAN